MLRALEKPYLYHMILRGEELRDGILYPLNKLATKYRDLYELHVAKYFDRPHILQQRIPHLDCLWGDVVFLTSVHPDRLCFALAQCLGKSFPSFAYQEIPVADLESSKLVIWPFLAREFDSTEVTTFDSDLLERSREVPESTKIYFREEHANQRRPLFFVHVPHILYKGSIDVSGYSLLYTEPREPKN